MLILFNTSSKFIDRFLGFMSTNTGLKPLIITEFISETQVKVGTIISFFFLYKFLSINILIKLAEDPEFTKVLYFTPNHLDHFFSNSKTFFDCVRTKSLFLINFLTSFISEFKKLLCING